MQEQWYAVIDKNTGDLISTGTVVGTDLPDNLMIKEIDGPPPDGHRWNSERQSFYPIPPIREIDRLDDILHHYAFPKDLTNLQIIGIQEAILSIIERVRFRKESESILL